MKINKTEDITTTFLIFQSELPQKTVYYYNQVCCENTLYSAMDALTLLQDKYATSFETTFDFCPVIGNFTQSNGA